jgi:hypothetical protein
LPARNGNVTLLASFPCRRERFPGTTRCQPAEELNTKLRTVQPDSTAAQSADVCLSGGELCVCKVTGDFGVKQLWEMADFVRNVSRQLRFGKFSRAPLQMLRFEWRGEAAECEWMIRPPDVWDRDLPEAMVRRDQTLQALRDALMLREILFGTMRGVQTARFRAYRPAANGSTELVITGTVNREDSPPPRVASEAMRAKLLGLQFTLDDGVLEPLPVKERHWNFAT